MIVWWMFTLFRNGAVHREDWYRERSVSTSSYKWTALHRKSWQAPITALNLVGRTNFIKIDPFVWTWNRGESQMHRHERGNTILLKMTRAYIKLFKVSDTALMHRLGLSLFIMNIRSHVHTPRGKNTARSIFLCIVYRKPEGTRRLSRQFLKIIILGTLFTRTICWMILPRQAISQKCKEENVNKLSAAANSNKSRIFTRPRSCRSYRKRNIRMKRS